MYQRKKKFTGRWIKLHNEELHNFYSSTKFYYCDQIIEDMLCGPCSMHDGHDQYMTNFNRKPQANREL
jgi:hypothetical protein